MLVWLAPIVLPLTCACLALVVRRRAGGWLVPVAALPALGLALLGAPVPPPDLSWILFDVVLGTDAFGRVLLALTAALWMVGGWYGATSMAGHPRRIGFTALSLVTMAGNIGLLLAADVVSLYLFFSMMTLSAYGLVIAERGAFAWRAGRVYLVAAVLGEALVLAALLTGVGVAGSSELTLFTKGVAASPASATVVGLLVGGFAVKAGIVPVHVWLPLAHPAAPVPASALLSGAIIKAGLVGWVRTLPAGLAPFGQWGALLLGAGIASAFLGVALGLSQRDPKVVLAYSSVSQMGIMAVLVGVALAVPEAATLAVSAVAVYALHHGLAKGALFLGVGLAKAESDRRRHRVVLAGMGLAAVSLAGLPLTSGALAKSALKDALGLLAEPWADAVTLAMSLAAAGTTVLMARLLLLLARPAAGGHAGASLLAPWAVLLGAVALATWVLPAALLEDVDVPTLAPDVVWDGLWPALLGAGVSAVLWWWAQARASRAPTVPPGDVVVLVEAGVRAVAARGSRGLAGVEARLHRAAAALRRVTLVVFSPGRGTAVVEEWLARWRVVMTVFVVLGVTLVAALLTGGG